MPHPIDDPRCSSCGAALTGATPAHMTDGRPLCATCSMTCIDCGRHLTWGMGRFLPSGGRRVCLVCDDRRDRAERQVQSERTTPSLRLCACGAPLASPLHTQCDECHWRGVLHEMIDRGGPTDEPPGLMTCCYCGDRAPCLAQPTPDGPLHFCPDCSADLLEVQRRALASGDWGDARPECHAEMMTSKRLHNPAADWYLDLVDALFPRGVGIDHSGAGIESNWDGNPDAFAHLLARQWVRILSDRAQRHDDDGAAA